MNGLILCTNECNLRCRYCFEEKMRNNCVSPIKHIREDYENFLNNYFNLFIDQLIEINKSINRKETDITLHGGEPLLIGNDLLERTLKMIRNRPNMTIGIQTNGTLIDDQTIALFKEYNVNVGISLDGPEFMHDAYRKNISGSGTHAIIMDNIQKLKNAGVIVGSLATVTDITIKHTDEFYNFFTNQNIPFSFNPCFIEKDAKSSCSVLNMNEYIDFYKKMFDLWIADDTNNMEVACFERIISALCIKKSPYMEVCTYIPDCSKTTVAVNVYGDFFRCLHYCADNKNRIGNLEFDNLKIAYGDESFSNRWQLLKDTECKDCNIKEFCCAGCPYVAESLNGTVNSKSNTCLSQYAIVHYIYDYLKKFQRNNENKKIFK